MSWQSMVYKKKEKMDRDSWAIIELGALKRDKFICRACDKQLEPHDASVHHIISRASGGSNNPDNLIALCRVCHNIIEGLGLMSRDEIFGYCVQVAPDPATVGRDWREIVYGGCRRH